jgi:hypothetical protein
MVNGRVDMQAQKLVGPMKRETLMALMTLLVRDSLTPAGSRPLPPSNVVSPAVSAYQVHEPTVPRSNQRKPALLPAKC